MSEKFAELSEKPDGQICQFGDCSEPATAIAMGRTYYENGHGLGWYCSAHADKVSDEGHPEYQEHCPNCGCRFGVN